jgi:hypothetical protein
VVRVGRRRARSRGGFAGLAITERAQYSVTSITRMHAIEATVPRATSLIGG